MRECFMARKGWVLGVATDGGDDRHLQYFERSGVELLQCRSSKFPGAVC